jgi:Flp pilus assembly protein TadD
MSVILDALRRARKGAGDERSSGRGGETTVRPVPAGLGLSAPRHPRPSRLRWAPLAGAAVIVALGAWLALRFISSREAASVAAPPATVSVQAPRGVAQTPAAPPDVEPVQPVLRAQNPEPGTPSPAPGAQSPEPRVQSGEPRAPGPAPKAQSPEPRVDNFELAVRYHRLGDFDQARRHYLAVLGEDEFHVEARNNLGLLYHERGMKDDAIEQFRRAIGINPRYITARSNAAVAFTSAGRLAEARTELRAALALEPRSADLLVNMALVEKADRRPEQAIELLLRAVGAEPAHAAAHYNLAVLYEERESFVLAYDHYGAFLTYAGPEHRNRLGDVQRRLGLIESRLERKP